MDSKTSFNHSFNMPSKRSSGTYYVQPIFPVYIVLTNIKNITITQICFILPFNHRQWWLKNNGHQTAQQGGRMSFPIDKILPLTDPRDSCEERLQIHFLILFHFSHFFLFCLMQLSVKSLKSNTYGHTCLDLQHLFLAIMSFGLKCSA